MREIKKDLKKIWVVITLLDGSKKTQDQIKEEINKIDKKIERIKENDDYYNFKTIKENIKDEAKQKRIKDEWYEYSEKGKENALIEFDKTSKTEIFGPLEEIGIIKRKDVPKEKSNVLPKLCWIPDNFDNLKRIIGFIHDSRIDPMRKAFFRNYFVSSKLGKKFMDELLSSIPELINDLNPPLNEKELKIVDSLILISPGCLKYVLDHIKEKSIIKNYDKDIFLFELQARFASNIMQLESNVLPVSTINQIHYKASITLEKGDRTELKDESVRDINIDIENNEFKTDLEFIPPSKDVSLDSFIGNYLGSYMYRR